MSSVFEVRYAEAARQDLLRLFDFLLERAKTAEDLDAAQTAIDAIREAVERNLSRAPFAYRKAGDSPFCWRRSKSEPPCRPNIEPGVEAGLDLTGCG